MNDRIDYYIEEYDDNKVTKIRSKDIEQILDQLDFYYEEEKTFNNLFHKRKLRYDYYIPRLNLLIEYDGEQHFKEIKFHKDYTNNDYVVAIGRDRIKDDYAINNDIHLMRIPFWFMKEDCVDRLMEFVQDHKLRLSSNAEHYIKALVEDNSTDLNYIKMNQLYEDYLSMLKELKVDNVVNYELFKFYLISTYHLNFIKTTKADNKWIDVYSQLENDEFEKYNTKVDKQFNNSVYLFILSITKDDIVNHTVRDVKNQYKAYCEENELKELGPSKFNPEIVKAFNVEQKSIKYKNINLGIHDHHAFENQIDNSNKTVKAWVED